MFLPTIAFLSLFQTSFAATNYTVYIDNLTFRQPFSGIFVAVHSRAAPPLYNFGEPASRALRVLAEDGDPSPLVQRYNRPNQASASFAVPGPVMPGQSAKFMVTIEDGEFLTLATMAVNTNDCFVALNAVKAYTGGQYYLNGLDSGTEENNELCRFIPGPACPAGGKNRRATNGAEGFVHVHRGFQGINEGDADIAEDDLNAAGRPLAAATYDWRNPMALVRIE